MEHTNQNGLIQYLSHLNITYREFAEIINSQKEEERYRNIDKTEEDELRIMHLAKGYRPTGIELLIISKIQYGSSAAWKKLLFPNNQSVLDTLLFTIPKIISRYDSKQNFLKFAHVNNHCVKTKYDLYQGLYNKKTSLKTLTLILISQLILDINAKYRSCKNNNLIILYDHYHNQLLVHAQELIMLTMNNEKTLNKLKIELYQNLSNPNKIIFKDLNSIMIRNFINLI